MCEKNRKHEDSFTLKITKRKAVSMLYFYKENFIKVLLLNGHKSFTLLR